MIYKCLKDQSIFDVCIQIYGSLEFISKLIEENSDVLVDGILTDLNGVELVVDEIGNFQSVKTQQFNLGTQPVPVSGISFSTFYLYGTFSVESDADLRNIPLNIDVEVLPSNATSKTLNITNLTPALGVISNVGTLYSPLVDGTASIRYIAGGFTASLEIENKYNNYQFSNVAKQIESGSYSLPVRFWTEAVDDKYYVNGTTYSDDKLVKISSDNVSWNGSGFLIGEKDVLWDNNDDRAFSITFRNGFNMLYYPTLEMGYGSGTFKLRVNSLTSSVGNFEIWPSVWNELIGDEPRNLIFTKNDNLRVAMDDSEFLLLSFNSNYSGVLTVGGDTSATYSYEPGLNEIIINTGVTNSNFNFNLSKSVIDEDVVVDVYKTNKFNLLDEASITSSGVFSFLESTNNEFCSIYVQDNGNGGILRLEFDNPAANITVETDGSGDEFEFILGQYDFNGVEVVKESPQDIKLVIDRLDRIAEGLIYIIKENKDYDINLGRNYGTGSYWLDFTSNLDTTDLNIMAGSISTTASVVVGTNSVLFTSGETFSSINLSLVDNIILSELKVSKVEEIYEVESFEEITFNRAVNLINPDTWYNITFNYIDGDKIELWMNGHPIRLINRDGIVEYNENGVFSVAPLEGDFENRLVLKRFNGFVDNMILFDDLINDRDELYEEIIKNKF